MLSFACGTRDKLHALRSAPGASLTNSGPAFRKVSAAKWRCGCRHGHGFRHAHGSPREHRAFLGVFSRPGRLHTHWTFLIGPKDAFSGRFWSVGRPRWDKWAYFAPYQTTKCHRAPRCYPTVAAPAGLALLNTPFFARPRRGYIRTRKNIPAFLCNLQWKVCKTPRDGIADVQIKCAGQQRPHPTLKSSRAGTLIAGPHRYTNAARAPSQNRLPEPRLTVRHDY